MIDTHAHLTDKQFSTDLPEVIFSAFHSGVKSIISVATQLDDAARCIALSQQYSAVYATVGIHPHEAKSWDHKSLDRMTAMMDQCLAIGEIGLDYYYDFAPHDLQKQVFLLQLHLANSLKMPVVIHCRDAFEDLKAILSAFPIGHLKGVIHCFTGSMDDARFLIDRGFYISFGGMLTFPKSVFIRDIAAWMPIERILLETDCPYMSPIPWRGTRNTPERINYVYEKLAKIRQLDIESIINRIHLNVQTCFGISQLDA